MATILVVDDSEVMRLMLAELFKRSEHTIVIATDGAEALSFAKEGTFDLVTTDLTMPGMTGINLVTQIRALPNYSNIPVLLITTENSPEEKSKAKLAGATGWITKPFSPTQLLETINRLL